MPCVCVYVCVCLVLQYRFMSLLGGPFRELNPGLALSILEPRLTYSDTDTSQAVERGVTLTRVDGGQVTPYDLKRLQVCDTHVYTHTYTCMLNRRRPSPWGMGCKGGVLRVCEPERARVCVFL